MGYYKQQEVAGQVEVGDRVPPPRPYIEHAVFFPDRRMRRLAEKRRRDWVTPVLIAMWAGIMFMMGMTLGIVL